MGKVATKPLTPRGCPPLQSGRKNQRWPTSGQGGYKTRAAWGVSTALERGADSEVAHRWAREPHDPCGLGGPQCFRAGGRFTGGPQVGKVTHAPLTPRRPHVPFVNGG